ncbi:MAG: sulfur carrier protein ThiS adenylyltransferase ThiF, partial [Bacteroidales bacterium]|nr:sulfur carrier protein ThiS adenylyltransferase ThiF [Bacteroidales bacterium]
MTTDQLQSALSTKTVGIAGCGGLGSNCAIALARVGVGRLIIADFDSVSESNLNRQYFFRDQIGEKKSAALKENIHRINPSVMVESLEMKLTADTIPAIFSSCNVVVEAFDLAEEKEMLIETMLRFFPGKPLVTGLGIAGWGKSEWIHLRKSDNLYICGDEVSE